MSINRLLRTFSPHEQRGYPYLVEIRPMLEKYRIKRQIREIARTIHIRRWHKVPHITLIYNFRPKKGVKDKDLAKIIREVVSKYSVIRFHYDGFELKKGRKGYVIAFKVRPSSELKRLRKELYDKLKTLIEERQDVVGFNNSGENEFWFHAAIGYRLSEREYRRAREFIQSLKSEYFPAFVLRICLLKRGKISYEYDAPTDRILTRKKALSKRYYIKMVKAFRDKIEHLAPSIPNPKENKIWLISDTHFDHANIIKYCARPFADVKEMNKVLVRNWNKTVKNNDIVYFLGDMTGPYCSRRLPCYMISYWTSEKVNCWMRKLKGNIIFIRGNHENENYAKIESAMEKDYEIIEYKEYKFLLIHDPKDIKRINKLRNFDGWIIHGHEHNNKLKNYPFINGERRTINVSVEVINYKPVSLDWILSLGLEKIKRMETILDEPEYF